MDTKQNTYIKADNNIIINEKIIRWVKKMGDCLEVCTKNDGCVIGVNTSRICKLNSPNSYHKLNQYFE